MEADLLLREYCKKLRLPTVAANTHRFAQDAAHNNLPYERFLLTLLECEVRQRALNQERRHIQAAHFPVLYTLDTFNFDAIPPAATGRNSTNSASWNWPKGSGSNGMKM
jgi:DNA replication protein DnaC